MIKKKFSDRVEELYRVGYTMCDSVLMACKEADIEIVNVKCRLTPDILSVLNDEAKCLNLLKSENV